MAWRSRPFGLLRHVLCASFRIAKQLRYRLALILIALPEPMRGITRVRVRHSLRVIHPGASERPVCYVPNPETRNALNRMRHGLVPSPPKHLRQRSDPGA
jgi:hypothetical protein